MSLTRRDLNLLLPALAASAAMAQDKKMLPSAAFKYEDLPVKVNGENRQRAVLNGTTHKGSAVEIHLTELGPGRAPHPPHKHLHEEMVLVRTGELDVTIAGTTPHLTPGSMAYVARTTCGGTSNNGSPNRPAGRPCRAPAARRQCRTSGRSSVPGGCGTNR